MAAAAGLSLLQRAAYPTSEPFFVPKSLPHAYERAFFIPATVVEGVQRLSGVVSHFAFAPLAAPRLLVMEKSGGPSVDFADIAILTPTAVSAVHWLLWAFVLVQAGRGSLARATGARSAGEKPLSRLPPVVPALALWLLLTAALHTFFGTSLFLYSGHWTFALLALAAWGFGGPTHAAGAPATDGRTRGSRLLLLLVVLQLAANAALVRQMLAVFRSES